MSSMVGLVGQSNDGAYSAPKGGIIAKSKGMALDLAPDGIGVNCVCPGWVRTPLVEDWFGQQEDPTNRAAGCTGSIPWDEYRVPRRSRAQCCFSLPSRRRSLPVWRCLWMGL